MASWCKACLVELPRYAETEDFFRENGIIRLFISIDSTPEEIEKCAELIQNHNIEGYFVTYSPPEGMSDYTFSRDIEPFFAMYNDEGTVSGASIPQYLIVGKDGNIVERKAKRPSDPQGLKEQLGLYLQ